jgi:restriction system protein
VLKCFFNSDSIQQHEILTIPDYQSIMLPLLKLSSDGLEHSSRQTVDRLANELRLTKEEKETIYPTKKVSMFYDRVHWALSYLKNARLIEGTKRGFFKITERGVNVLKQNPEDINVRFLKQFPEFTDFLNRSRDEKEETNSQTKREHREDITNKTPEEIMEDGYQLIRENLVREILENVKKSSPVFFERLVVELLVAMGYGGSIKEAGRAIGKVGDEGIDGIIKEDILGLDAIYIQAKKWEGTIGRPEIQKFAGALQGQRAKKGIFITTGNFSNDAKEYISKIDSKIVLVDGNQLGEYLIDNNIGITTEKTYQIKKVNSDYFEEPL